VKGSRSSNKRTTKTETPATKSDFITTISQFIMLEVHRSTFLFLSVCLCVAIFSPNTANGFTSPSIIRHVASAAAITKTTTIPLYSSVKDKPQTSAVQEDDDEEAPAGIAGAEFFGGNKQKEELYDPVAEREAGRDLSTQATSFDRFTPSKDGPFETTEVASLAKSLQRQINQVLYVDNAKLKRVLERNEDNDGDDSSVDDVAFGPSVSWQTPLTKSLSNPIDELKAAMEFYQSVDLAIVAGKPVSEGVVELAWELSLVWPTFWSPRVALSGTSTLSVSASSEETIITKQTDRVFGADNNAALISLLGGQITPRFWDWYHIGMTPSAEQVPRQTVAKKGGVTVYKIPPQLVTAPTLIETGTRENRNAQMVPNHSFTCVIKTMGPAKDRDVYVPTTPVEVWIGRNNRKENSESSELDDRLLLSWSIPLSTQFQALNKDLLLPAEDDPEAEEGSFPECSYAWQPMRQVATVKFGGNVQDEEISDIRKKLYEQVMKEGWKPKLDENRKPKFFFWQNDVKACYIEDGLGMVVYDWRPEFANSNEVGIELLVE